MSVERFLPNLKGNDWVMGDLHGCLELFNTALKDIEFNPEVDRMFSVGDLVDRGPNSIECLDLLNQPWFHAVKGNHEDMMLGVHRANWPKDNYIANGGSWFFQVRDSTKDAAARLVEKLPLVIVIDHASGKRFNIVHAEMPLTDKDIDEGIMWPDSFIWSRTLIKSSRQPGYEWKLLKEGLSPTFVGHTVLDQPEILESHIFIDTGAVFSGRLTLVKLGNELEFVEVTL